MSTKAKGQNKSGDDSDSPPPPPPGRKGTGRPPSTSKKRRPLARGYSLPRDKSSKVTILLCVFDGYSSGWKTKSLTFDRYRTTDRELWEGIRRIFRDELQKPWRRILLFKRLKHIVPIEYTRNDTPIRTDPKNYPESHEMMHCYRHPDKTRTNHQWVDWFIKYRKDPEKMYGLEFVEGLWAEKVAALAVISTIAIIVVSVVWVVYGGSLQTVFTVMSFVLGGMTAEIALLALYYQVTLPG